MKALVISGDENLINNFSNSLKNNGYDIIVYKWLLKALDNIEEIQPDLIVVSSSEYPRHWKTLVQFVKSGIGGANVQIYLFEPTPLSKDDLDKAKILGITGFFSDPHDLDSLISGESEEIPEVSNILANNSDKEEKIEPITDAIDLIESVIPEFGHILITHPENKNFITGKVNNIKDDLLTCVLDFNTNLKAETILNKVTYIFNGEIKSFEGVITSIQNKELEIQIQKYYEE